ncbi:hypothetical protein SLE2022_290600 [Rubroshorea leprosula]
MAEKDAATESVAANSPTEDMDLKTAETNADNQEGGVKIESDIKREREEGGEDGDASKKQKVEEPVKEESLEKSVAPSGPVSLGSKQFESSVEMFDYFFKFLHFWPPNVNVNKYEHMVLLDLLKKGHAEPDKKIGGGIQAFQVRYHPMWKSRCFFLVRDDETVDDFSFRKCVDHILPLPEDMKPEAKAFGSGGGGKVRGGKGGWRGRGRGGKSGK